MLLAPAAPAALPELASGDAPVDPVLPLPIELEPLPYAEYSLLLNLPSAFTSSDWYWLDKAWSLLASDELMLLSPSVSSELKPPVAELAPALPAPFEPDAALSLLLPAAPLCAYAPSEASDADMAKAKMSLFVIDNLLLRH